MATEDLAVTFPDPERSVAQNLIARVQQMLAADSGVVLDPDSGGFYFGDWPIMGPCPGGMLFETDPVLARAAIEAGEAETCSCLGRQERSGWVEVPHQRLADEAALALWVVRALAWARTERRGSLIIKA